MFVFSQVARADAGRKKKSWTGPTFPLTEQGKRHVNKGGSPHLLVAHSDIGTFQCGVIYVIISFLFPASPYQDVVPGGSPRDKHPIIWG
jgi:hypothetical protein